MHTAGNGRAMNDKKTLDLEALKLLKDWSVWMVTVETAVLAFLGAASSIFDLKAQAPAEPWFIGTVLCFSLSIIFAAWVLSGIPSVVQRIDDTTSLHKQKIYDISWLPDCVTLNCVAIVQHTLFALGLVGFAVLVMFFRRM
jgi:hypothetical protein